MDSKSEIFSQRLIIAVLWNICLQTALAIGLVFMIQVDLLHPLTWITTTLNDITGWKMALNITLLTLVSFFQAYIYGNYYMTPLPKRFTRFSMFLNMFSFQNVTFITLYALSGYFTMALYSSLAKSSYHILKKNCKNYDGQCLMEQSLFLQFGGMWMGVYYFLSVHVIGSTILVFPHIYQDKFQQIKLAISNIISIGFQSSFVPVIYYCIFYWLWGSRPRHVVSEVYSLYLEDPPLDNLFNLLKSGIWIGLWFYTSLFFISVYTMRTVFNVILTEPMKFAIESDKELVLYKALEQRSQFNGYLGAQDLKIMAMTDYERRKQIFTLSLPGGHPHNWNNLLDQCLSIIKDFNRLLDTVNGEIKPTESENSSGGTTNANRIPDSPYTKKIRNMAQSPYIMKLGIMDYNDNRSNLQPTIATSIKREYEMFINKLCQKPGINYLFGELMDTKLKYILLQSQPVMWTCEGLSFLAAASLKEDSYGVVQNDLPEVISVLIQLKQSLDKLTKPGLIPRKHILNNTAAIQMRSALASTVKRSLYRIVLTFSKYMNVIPLDPEVQVAIQPFLLCKEA